MSGAQDLADVVKAIREEGVSIDMQRGGGTYDPATGSRTAVAPLSWSVLALPVATRYRRGDGMANVQDRAWYVAGDVDVQMGDKIGHLTVDDISDTVSGGVVVLRKVTAVRK